MKLAGFFFRLAGVPVEDTDQDSGRATDGTIIVVGSPNVGKSVLFNRLTGRHVIVSNYPGTTVEVTRGYLRTNDGLFEVIDTPGIYSLNPITAEEQVTFDYLFDREVKAVIHVLDAKNIERMLPLTLQLAEAGLPLLLALNMADEAADLGFRFDLARLREHLGVPVVRTVATTGAGIRRLIRLLPEVHPAQPPRIDYGPCIESALTELDGPLRAAGNGRLSPRTLGLLLLQSERAAFERLLPSRPVEEVAGILRVVAATQRQLDHAPHCYATFAVKKLAASILARTVRFPPPREARPRERLSRALMRPAIGIPVLLLVLYFGLYKFVGEFGAGVLVDAISGAFERWVQPGATRAVAAILPWQNAVAGSLRELLTGEYGIVPLGLNYALAIVMPIVGTFFLAFSILEDSGYLPRLAMMIDRGFKRIGLNGRAVIPMVLGFGCGTMAVMVTRTLESRRERIIATLLLALAIPCAAQMGVILALLASHPGGLVLWIVFMSLVFLLAGLLAARLMPGRRPDFYMELPPMRLPRPSNIVAKTLSRMTWYFQEVLPLFILASVLIWIGQMTGAFQFLIRCIEPVAGWMGLPPQAAKIFLFGFFRRDYGAAGLYELQMGGVLTGNQLTVAAIALSLFLPCIAQFLVMGKERGWRTAFAIGATTLALALVAGLTVHHLLLLTGIEL